jgi:hypothetical protein
LPDACRIAQTSLGCCGRRGRWLRRGDLRLSGVTEIIRTLQAITRDRNRILDYLPL